MTKHVSMGDTIYIHYKGSLEDGTLFDETKKEEPFQIEMGQYQIIEGLEEALLDLNVGDKKEKIKILPQKAYGDYQEDLVVQFEKSALGEDVDTLELGQHLVFKSKEGQEMPAYIVDINETHITVDGNHYLAGETLYFDIEIVEIIKA